MNPLGELLGQFLDANPMVKAGDITPLLQHWGQLLGPYLAERIRPVRFERGQLICQVSSPALIQEFSFVQREILAKLRLFSGGELIRSIKCVTQPGPRQQQSEELARIQTAQAQRENQYQKMKETPLAPWEEELIRRQTRAISDTAMREQVERMLQAMTRRKKQLQSQNWPHCLTCQSFFEPVYTRCPYCHLFVFAEAVDA